MTADRLAEGIVTWKFVAFRLPRVFRLMPVVPVPVVVVVPVVPVVPVFVVLMLLCSVTVALVGGLSPKRTRPVFADLHDRDVNDDFRTRLVQIFDELLSQRDLIRGPAHNQGVLREQLLHALHIEHGANRVHHILQFGGS